MRSLIFSFLCLLYCGSLFAQVVFGTYGIGPDNFQNGIPNQMISYQNKLLLSARDATQTPQLWTCNGTPTGTKPVVALPPSAPRSVSWLTELNGKIIFQGSDTGGVKLWSTDGTNTGTKVLKYMAGGFPAYGFTPLNNHLIFGVGDWSTPLNPLWITDGTDTGTKLVSRGEVRMEDVPIAYNGLVYFVGHDNAHGYELWCTDGTEGNTRLVKDINPGTANGMQTVPNFCIYKGKLYFSANDGTHGYELWVTDGSAAGTYMVKDIYPGSQYSLITNIIVYKGFMYFSAQVDNSKYRYPIKSDGTTAGTDVFNTAAGTWPEIPMLVFKDMLYFATGSYRTPALFRTDGTSMGTTIVKDANGDTLWFASSVGSPWYDIDWKNHGDMTKSSPIALYAGRLYFYCMADTGNVLVSTDGTDAGTTEIVPPSAGSNYFISWHQFCVSNNRLYLEGRFGNGPYQLWSIYDSAGVAGVGKITTQDICTIFPNPSHDIVSISFKSTQQNIDINITDLNGRIIQRSHFTASANVQLDVRAMNTGMYFVNVTADDKKQSLKFLKE